jgi:ribose transport system ATP-binding protein
MSALMENDLVLKLAKVSKSFGPVRALRAVDFELRKGEIHAIAGENGAGKSTLMKIIDGIVRPDSGQIFFQGELVEISSPAMAQRLGIGLVHQEIALCPDVSVAENIFMGSTSVSKSVFMDYKVIEARAKAALSALCNVSPTMLVRDLSISQQQLVEIAKALTLDCRVLILDEPTAALTEKEAQILFGIMRKLADQGISIIYISHRMVEIFDNCDRVTVFRDGQYVMTRDIADITPSDVVAAMVGRVIENLYPDKQADHERSDEVILAVRDLTETSRFRKVTFDLKRGEILGLAGLIGAGRSEIAKGICRLEGQISGEVLLYGKSLRLRHYRDSIDHGIVYLSEDRKGDGIFLDMPIAANISALAVEQVATRLGIVDDTRELEQARRLGKSLNLRYDDIRQPASSLSGGNQQKVAIAKMLSVRPKVILLDEPTRGVDVGAKAEIHRILRALAQDGVGILVISSELPELIGVCDRVLVVREGEITGEVAGDRMTEENIMYLASIEPAQAGAA